jgi:hypothetical protein
MLFNARTGRHLVKYDDGDEEALDLRKSRLRWLSSTKGGGGHALGGGGEDGSERSGFKRGADDNGAGGEAAKKKRRKKKALFTKAKYLQVPSLPAFLVQKYQL